MYVNNYRLQMPLFEQQIKYYEQKHSKQTNNAQNKQNNNKITHLKLSYQSQRVIHIVFNSQSSPIAYSIDRQMKLNFSTLANQVKKSNQQESIHDDISSQLNYYRKSANKKHDNISNSVKQKKKTQLQRQDQSSRQSSASILIGSSIISDYFSPNPHIDNHASQQQPSTSTRINLAVMYPYELSTSIDTNDIDNQIKQMNQKGILNESAMRFIKREITKDLSKSKERVKKQDNQSLMNKDNKIYSNESMMQLQSEQVIDNSNNEHNLITTANSYNNIDSETKHLLFKNFSKETLSSKQIKNNQIVIPNFLQSSLQKQKGNKKYNYASKQPNYMKPKQQQTINKKKGKNQPLISTQTIKLQQQLKQVKQKPSLQLTKSSPFTHRIQQQRNTLYKQKNTNVFIQLYQQSYVRECMKSIQRQSIYKNIEERQNLDKTLKTEYSQQRYHVKESFKQRLQRSIEKKYYQEYLIKKYSVDQRTGQQYFYPDTTLSRHTYQRLFKKSLQKPTTQPAQLPVQQEAQNKKSIFISNNNINQFTSSSSAKNISSVSYKSAARTKQNSVQRLSHSVDREGDGNSKGQKGVVRVDGKSAEIVDKLNEKMFNRIAGMFYHVMDEQQQHQQQEDFNKTSQSLSLLQQHQCHILSPLFKQIQSLQQSTRVSQLMFKSLLQQFFYKLNYYDQLVLRQIGVKNKRKITNKVGKSNKQNNKQSIRKMTRQNNTHKPRINDISSSMQKLNPKYDEALYFV